MFAAVLLDARWMEAPMPLGKSGQQGFTYLMLLSLMAVMLAGLSVVGPLWSAKVQREQEQDLLRIGLLYAAAIDSYYNAPNIGLKAYPHSIDELLLDKRTTVVVRHLRRAYPDPVNPDKPWVLITGADGSIRGVASSSTAMPLHRTALQLEGVRLVPGRTYQDWKFMAETSP
jgi:type II secretory pathway pseudopilin PulG